MSEFMISVILPYYDNPQMLQRQYDNFSSYPKGLRDRLELIVVDDTSPNHPLSEQPYPEELNLKRAQIEGEDIPWAWARARNLGAHLAEEEWLLLTDIDHLVPADTFRGLCKLRNGKIIYTLAREDTRGIPVRDSHGNLKPHPNSFFMTKKLFWKTGGYDETYIGNYGAEGVYRKRVYSQAKRQHLPDLPLILVDRDDVPDANSSLPRKEGRDPAAISKITAKKHQRGEANLIRTLEFQWTLLS